MILKFCLACIRAQPPYSFCDLAVSRSSSSAAKFSQYRSRRSSSEASSPAAFIITLIIRLHVKNFNINHRMDGCGSRQNKETRKRSPAPQHSVYRVSLDFCARLTRIPYCINIRIPPPRQAESGATTAASSENVRLCRYRHEPRSLRLPHINCSCISGS